MVGHHDEMLPASQICSEDEDKLRDLNACVAGSDHGNVDQVAHLRDRGGQ